SYAYRTQLLTAMEVFVVAHEYAHFLAEERQLQFADAAELPQAKALEFFCDKLGLQIVRQWASPHDNWLAFTGVGPIVFFSALHICEKCAFQLARRSMGHKRSPAGSRGDESSHPPI